MKANYSGEYMKNEDKDKVQYFPLGMCIGISIGVAIGAALNNISLYMCIGLCVGTCVGAVIDYQNRKAINTDAQPEDEEQK